VFFVGPVELFEVEKKIGSQFSIFGDFEDKHAKHSKILPRTPSPKEYLSFESVFDPC
jgi:hypothetical protein